MPEERVAPSMREYSFESCPEVKLAACAQYEYLRSSELILSAVERFRGGETDSLAKAVPLLFGPDIFWTLKDNSWPHLPYLEADKARDKAALQKQKSQKRNLAHLLTPWPHLYVGDNVARIVPVYIFPGLTLFQLKEGFGDLLQCDYPELLEPPWPGPKPGRGSVTQQDRTDLKALSAWRLQRKFGYSAKAAIKLMHEDKLIDTYHHQRTFYRAVTRAAQKIAALEEQLRELAKNMTA